VLVAFLQNQAAASERAAAEQRALVLAVMNQGREQSGTQVQTMQTIMGGLVNALASVKQGGGDAAAAAEILLKGIEIGGGMAEGKADAGNQSGITETLMQAFQAFTMAQQSGAFGGQPAPAPTPPMPAATPHPAGAS
jgi:hypothetical protein